MVEHEEMIVRGRLRSPNCEICVERFGGGGVQADQPALVELGLADDKPVRCDIGQPQSHGFTPPDPCRGDQTQHVVPGERRHRPHGFEAQGRGEERAQLLRRDQVRRRALIGMRAEEVPWREFVAGTQHQPSGERDRQRPCASTST